MASERGTAQTGVVSRSQPLRYRGWKARRGCCEDPQELPNWFVIEGTWEGRAIEGDSPVDETNQSPAADLEYHGAR